MNARNSLPCNRTAIRSPGSLWRLAVLLLLMYGLLLSVLPHSALVHAQFAANPFPLTSSYALLLNGIATADQSGVSVSGVGDVNGDNVDDFVVGALFANPYGVGDAGQAYLLFGRNASTPWTPSPLELSTLDGTYGVTLNGVVSGKWLGLSVAGVQDVNGDGINDVLIGTHFENVVYLVFGRNDPWPAAVNLTQGAFNGVAIVGNPLYARTGFSVSGAGDVNNDGIPDFAIGTPLAPKSTKAGRMDVLYGRPSGSPWPDVVNLTTYVNASTGFFVAGDNDSDYCGIAVAGLGDVNGDGVDDVAVGCPSSDPPNAFFRAGKVAVVFGSSTGSFPNSGELNGTFGFVVNGQLVGDELGDAVSGVGDVNADGLDDFAIGARRADANALVDSGEMYVLFGRNASEHPWPAQVNSSSLDGDNGFALAGSDAGDFLGESVSPAGDVNGDGIEDLLVGATREGCTVGIGFVLLLYGRSVWPSRQNSSEVHASTSVMFEGIQTDDRCGYSVSSLGDVNGDGRPDLAIGCDKASPGGRTRAGVTAIVFGPAFTSAPTTGAPSTASPSTPSPTIATTTSPTTPITASPTASTCDTQGAFVPPGASCVNGVLITTSNTTVPTGTPVTVITSVTVTGGASFEQPSGSTLVFVAGGGSSSTSIAVEDGGCATIAGDAVVSFESDPTTTGNTATLVLVTSDCVMGAFGSVTATTAFEGDECVAVGDGDQESGANSISVTFAVSNTCDSKSSGLSTGALAGIIAAGVIVVVLIVVAISMFAHRKRVLKREASLSVRLQHRSDY